MSRHIISSAPNGVSTLFGTGKMVFIGFLIIVSFVIIAFIHDHEQELKDLIEGKSVVENPVPMQTGINLDPINDLFESQENTVRYEVHVNVDQYVLNQIVDVAKSKPKNEYMNMGYDGDTADRLADIRESVDMMDCSQLEDTFMNNPGWSLRSYVAHTFLEKC